MKALLAALAALVLVRAAQAHEVLVASNATWKYLDDGSNQGTAWRASGFVDSAWASGPAELGYGDGDEATLVGFGPNPNQKYVTTYFRHTFAVADPSVYAGLTLRLRRDDGAVVYLNGVEVARSNIIANPSSTTYATSVINDTNEITWRIFAVAPTQLAIGTNVLAVEMHQANATSSDLSFALELLGCRPACVLRGPYLQRGTADGVVVRWRTGTPSDSRVSFGFAPNALTQSTSDATSTTEHEIALSGLAASTKYFYAVGTSTNVLVGGDPEHYFVTAPSPGTVAPLHIWVIGDSGTANNDARDVRDAYEALTGSQPTSFWLMLGDNAYLAGTDAEYQTAVFDMYSALLATSVLWPTRGNHDMDVNVYTDMFTLPDAAQAGGVPSGSEAYYSFDWSNVHFVCLDSYGSDRSVGGPMWTWLQADLAATARDWIIAFWHHPPYSKGSHDSDVDVELIEMRNNFLPLLEANGVDLVLCGHSHCYERSFLIDGHYGLSSTFNASMVVDGGDGRADGDGPYVKRGAPNDGAVYCVAGCSGQHTGGALDHPAMYLSLDQLGSLVLDIDGGRLDARFIGTSGASDDHFTLLASDYVDVYCQSQITSSGCTPAIGFTGAPSATDPTPFDVGAAQVEAAKTGLLFYGFASHAAPFLGGTLCVAQPVSRTPVQSSGGAAACSGAFHYDFNARIQSGADVRLVPGESVFAQYWFRDPAAASTTGLSDALVFVIQD
jgi:hypothetical protein